MKYIQRYGFLALVGLALTGCAMPQAMLFNVDVLQPKAFTLAVDEQPVAVVAAYKDKDADSTASAILALGAARSIETSNALEEGAVGAFTIPQDEYPGASDKEYMEGLMLATGSGTLVIIKDISYGKLALFKDFDEKANVSTIGMQTIMANMEVYDAITDTTIYSALITDSLHFRFPANQDLSQKGISSFLAEHDSLLVSSMGALLAKHISNQWIEEEWMLIDYPEEPVWHNAYKDAMDFKWDKAINVWMPMTEDKNPEKASYAAFNIAVACQMLGETDLAIGWVEYSLGKYSFQEARQLNQYLHNQKKIQDTLKQ